MPFQRTSENFLKIAWYGKYKKVILVQFFAEHFMPVLHNFSIVSVNLNLLAELEPLFLF